MLTNRDRKGVGTFLTIGSAFRSGVAPVGSVCAVGQDRILVGAGLRKLLRGEFTGAGKIRASQVGCEEYRFAEPRPAEIGSAEGSLFPDRIHIDRSAA